MEKLTSWGLAVGSYFFFGAAALKIAAGILIRTAKTIEPDKNTKD